MRHSNRTLTLTLAAALFLGMHCLGQEVEPPFTWEGKGAGSFISEEGTRDVDLQLKLSIDELGMVSGEASSEDGSSSIKHVFYTEPEEYEVFPGFFTRKIVIVFMINEYGDNPLLSVLNGRILGDKFLYGELSLTRFEEGTDTAKALGVGNAEATLMEDGLPESLKAALKDCIPIGIAKIEGDYKKEETRSAASGSSKGSAMALFNEKDLSDWYIYLKDDTADPKGVWKVQDGAIWCKGQPTGFLRTKEKYGDFKLSFDWRWPEKPGNSGVLLRMTDEEKIWPLCMEAQLMHQRAGDFVGMSCSFNESENKEGPFRFARRKNESNEKEPGDWNTYEIVCKGGTMELTVNGLLQNKATGVEVREGYIGFQSEGVPIMFRNIQLTPIK